MFRNTIFLFSSMLISGAAHAEPRSMIALYLTQTSLDGEPTSEDAGSLDLFIGGIQSEEKYGFGTGFYYKTNSISPDIKEGGFGLVAGRKASFDSRTIGLQFAYLFPTETEISLGFGNKVIKYSQDSTSASAGAWEFQLSLSQEIGKSFAVSLYASTTDQISMRTASESYDTKMTSYGIGVGYLNLGKHD